jgi:hypothetical protein
VPATLEDRKNDPVTGGVETPGTQFTPLNVTQVAPAAVKQNSCASALWGTVEHSVSAVAVRTRRLIMGLSGDAGCKTPVATLQTVRQRVLASAPPSVEVVENVC